MKKSKKYMREYYLKNKERIKKYYQKHKRKILKQMKQYQKNNKEKILLYNKKYYQKNQQEIILKGQKYYRNNKEKTLLNDKEYYQSNRTEILERVKKYQKNRMKIDINFKLIRYLRSRIRNTLKGLNKSKSTMKLVGCSIEFLKQYLEKHFTSGMSFSNYGKWHIDHIIPCCKFDLSKPSEQKKCFHYINLQPLWAEDNLSKNKYQGENDANYYRKNS